MTLLLATLALLAAGGNGPVRSQLLQRPNVLIIVTDDQRYGTVLPQVMPATARWFRGRGT